MPQIIVIADTPGEGGAARVMFRERVTKRDFESGHFATQLAERLGWAVGDAHAVDHREQATADRSRRRRRFRRHRCCDRRLRFRGNASASLGESRHHGLVDPGAVTLGRDSHPRLTKHVGLEGGVAFQRVGRQPERSHDARRVQVLA